MRRLLCQAMALALAYTAIAVVPAHADQERFFDGRRDLRAAGADLHRWWYGMSDDWSSRSGTRIFGPATTPA